MLRLFYKFLVIWCVISICFAAKKKSKGSTATVGSATTQTIWSNYKLDKPIVKSYLLQSTESNNKHAKFIQDLVDIIYTKQNPPKSACPRSRLMFLQMSSTSFEGTGSLLKQVMLSTAIAMHSNRTLMWGLGYPFMFEHSLEAWGGEDASNLTVNNEVLNCTQDDMGAGAFGCFFEPLSTCAIEDVFPGELVTFSENPFNDSARVTLSEIRKGVALYHPPQGLFEHIFKLRKYSAEAQKSILQHKSHIWAAAVTTYVFRLKDSLLQSFYQRYSHIVSPPELTKGGGGKKGTKKPITWGMHVRHGDLKALSNVYGYKEVFEFDDFFNAALKLSHDSESTPDRLFIATDSVEADQLPSMFTKFLKQKQETAGAGNTDEEEEDDEEEDDEDNEDEEEDDEEEEEESDEEDDDQYTTFYDTDKKPSILTITNANRYRTPHGSHTVAANGGCLRDDKYQDRGMRCALNYEAIVQYQTMDEHRTVPRSLRLMRVLLESIEDIFLLSHSDKLIGQGSSHFSTLAALLVFARTLGMSEPTESVHYLDEPTIITGVTPTAFLHGMNLLNGTHSIDDQNTPGEKRWEIHTYHFLAGIAGHEELTKFYSTPEPSKYISAMGGNPWKAEQYMRLVNGLPQLPEKIFYYETKTWLFPRYQAVYPGQCPGLPDKPQSVVLEPIEYMTHVVNLGVDHLSFSHSGQAIQCWADVLTLIQELTTNPMYKKLKIASKQLQDIAKIAKDNKLSLRILRYGEMAINENRSVKDYLEYTNAYMKGNFDDAAAAAAISRGGRGGKSSSFSSSGNSLAPNIPGQEGKELMSLEDVNEKILKLQKELKRLQSLQERLVQANLQFLNGKFDDVMQQEGKKK